MKRSLNASSSTTPDIADAVQLASIHSHGHQTKSATVSVLLDLQKAGKLNGNETTRSLRRKVQVGVEAHSHVETPYGPMVQQIQIGTSSLSMWDICNPLAFLYYMSSISTYFCTVMRDCATRRAGLPLRLVLYADEMIPGNPFRPDQGRKLMCIYWTFVDWPGWMLTRSFAWPCFSILRSSVIKELTGGMSYLARVILHHFFPSTGDSLERGLVLKDPNGEPYLVKAMFAGWLCDLAGHKEILNWKAGLVTCAVQNVVTCIRITGVHSKLMGPSGWIVLTRPNSITRLHHRAIKSSPFMTDLQLPRAR